MLRATMRAVSQRILVFLASIALLGGCNRGTAPASADAGARATTARPVQAGNPTLNPWPRIVVLHGQLEANASVQIAARVEGAIERVYVDLGDEVRSGAPLARIAAVDFNARAAQARAQLAQAQSDLARFEGLERPGSIAAQEIERARTAVEVARANLALANRELGDSRIRAPFAGAVARRYVDRGAFVRVGAPLFDFVSTGPMRLALEVPENFVRDVRPGLMVRVLPEASAGEGFAAEVVRVGPVVAQGTRTFRIEAAVESNEGRLRPGMFVLGILELGMDPEAVRIARGAVYSVLGHDRVTLVVDGKAETRDVELLGEDRGDAIVHGLRPADLVVLRGGGGLAPGEAVRVSETVPAPAAAAPTAQPVRSVDAGTGR